MFDLGFGAMIAIILSKIRSVALPVAVVVYTSIDNYRFRGQALYYLVHVFANTLTYKIVKSERLTKICCHHRGMEGTEM